MANSIEIARTRIPAIVVLEDSADGSVVKEFARAIGDLETPQDGAISLIAVSAEGTGPIGADDLDITDSFVWPASNRYIRTKLRAWLLRRACRWRPAPLPDDEAARLRSLHDLGEALAHGLTGAIVAEMIDTHEKSSVYVEFTFVNRRLFKSTSWKPTGRKS